MHNVVVYSSSGFLSVKIHVSSGDRRGRMSREERVELLKKERSQTSGRLLMSGEDRGHLTSARSKTSGRDVERRIKDQAWTTSVKRDRSPVDWKLSDRGGRYQVTYLYESLQTTILNRRRGNDSEVMSAGMMRELLPGGWRGLTEGRNKTVVEEIAKKRIEEVEILT